MDSKRFILAAVGTLLVIWYFGQRQADRDLIEDVREKPTTRAIEIQPPKTAVQAPKATPKVATVEIQPIKAAPVGPVQDGQMGAKAKPQQPPGDFVEFRVVEGGHALGYGDVVLGKIPEGTTITSGVTEAKPTRLWPSSQIPYVISQGVANRQPIEDAIAYFAANTSIRFVPYTNQPDSVVFVPTTELCASYLGRAGGPQPLFVSPQCGTNEVLHELMHALGFVHEHSRVDRDKFVEVVWENIDPKFWLQYYMVPDRLIHEYVGSVFSFDHESIMLYEPTFFAKEPGLVTMRSRTNQEIKPVKNQLSRTDLERIYYLYGR